MATKKQKQETADQLEKALEAFEVASPEDRLDTAKGSVSDVVHAWVRAGLELVGHQATDVQVLYARGFINHDDPDSWNKAVQELIAELRA